MVANAARLIEARAVDWIQVREKDLSPRDLAGLAVRILAIARPAGVLVFVNERADVAIAAKADGVHLPCAAIGLANHYRSLAPRPRIGISCHNAAELQQAHEQGVDFAVLGPVFAPLSKAGEGMGLARFAELTRSARIPVLAIGGITVERTPECILAGAVGVAGISLFQIGKLPKNFPNDFAAATD